VDLAGFAYVDDTDLIQVDNCVDMVVQNMQAKLNLWNDLVSVKGGILSPKNTCHTWSHLSTIWENGHTRIMRVLQQR
jgi:hypothetical protein